MDLRRAAVLAASSAAGLIPLPGVVAGDERNDLPLVVTDAGRAGFVSSLDGQGVAGIVAPGARTAMLARLDGELTGSGGVAFDADGTLVAAVTRPTGEAPAAEFGKTGPCCERPYLVRWAGPGNTPSALPAGPDRHVSFGVGAFALDHAGTAFLVLDHEAEYVDEPFATALRVPRVGPATWRDVDVDVEPPMTYDLRVHDDGTGATALTSGDVRPHRLSADAGPWRASGAPLRPASSYPSPVLAAGDRVVHVRRHDGALRLVAEGRRGELAIGRATAGALEADDVGRDGTVAVVWTRGDAVLLRTVSPSGRRRTMRRLGRIRHGAATARVLVSVDDAGHAHAAFTAPDGRVVVVGPSGRRVLGSGSATLWLSGLAVSPRGAEAVTVATPPRWLLMVRPAPRAG